MTQTTATTAASVQYCYDIIIDMDPPDENNRTDLIERLKSLKKNSLEFLQKAQRGTHGNTLVLRIWTVHIDIRAAQRDLSTLSTVLRAIYAERQLTVWIGYQVRMRRFSSFDEATQADHEPFNL
jgi:hypothetical protein